MSHISSVNAQQLALTRLNAPPLGHPSSKATEASAGVPADQDRLEVSEIGRWMGELNNLPEVRQGRIDAIRAQIDANTYATDEKLDAALDAMIEDLTDEPTA